MGEFITPDVLPEDTFCRVLLIPNDPKWIGAVSGALLPMMYASEWVSFGGLTPEETAERCRVMLYEFWASDGCPDMNCCPPEIAIRRFNPDTGRPEVSYDGGTTWGGDPADPENLVQLYPPLVTEGGSKTKCDAATNASQHINELITATGENLTAASSVFDFAVGVAGAILALFLIIVSAGALTAPVTAVVTAIWVAAAGAFDLGIALFEAYWTTDKQDAILCSLFCHIGENGQFTEAQYQAFRTDIKDTLPASAAFDIVMTAINAGGARGLSQMASYGNAALADCDSCECSDPCDIDNWHNALWYGGNYLTSPTVGTFGTEIDRGADYITIQSTDRGDGQQAISLSTADGLICCGFTAEFIGGAPGSTLHFFNYCDNHAAYETMVQDNTAPFTQAFTQCYLQMDPGSWTVKFTVVP